MLEIRRCRAQEIDRVMAFIEAHWQRGHVLAVDRRLMDWQHRTSSGSYDYLIAIEHERILGVLGYIATRRFDPMLIERNVLWLALWKVLDDSGVGGLGLRLLNVLNQIEPHVAIAVNGINASHPPMYRALRYHVGELQRYFVVNPDQPSRLVSAPSGMVLPMPCDGGGQWIEMFERGLMALPPDAVVTSAVPIKTPTYFVHRFLRHPYYRYRVFLTQSRNDRVSIFATRTAEHESARAVRIVDFAGDSAAIAECGGAVASLMREERAEYADFWQSGLSNQHFAAAGFALLDPNGPVVVPNFFEPFLASNGRMIYAARTVVNRPIIVCRADGDQDRPNRLEEVAR